GQGRVGSSDPAAPDVAGTGHRLHRRGRTGRSDAQVDPSAQGRPESVLPQEARPPRIGLATTEMKKAVRKGRLFCWPTPSGCLRPLAPPLPSGERNQTPYFLNPSRPSQPPLVNRATSSNARASGVLVE